LYWTLTVTDPAGRVCPAVGEVILSDAPGGSGAAAFEGEGEAAADADADGNGEAAALGDGAAAGLAGAGLTAGATVAAGGLVGGAAGVADVHADRRRAKSRKPESGAALRRVVGVLTC
jgi:hypothetical protein